MNAGWAAYGYLRWDAAYGDRMDSEAFYILGSRSRETGVMKTPFLLFSRAFERGKP